MTISFCFPAIKIGKLAVDIIAKSKYHGIGSLMIKLARGFAYNMNNDGVACRYLTIDADIENSPNVTEFYEKNGFTPNERLSNKKRLSMRRQSKKKTAAFSLINFFWISETILLSITNT